jgi:hypothetical protein
MEAQLDGNPGNAPSGFVAPLVVLPSGSISPNGMRVQPASPFTIGPAIVTLPQTVANFAFVVTPDMIPSGGGSDAFQPIHVGDLPPPATPPAPLPPAPVPTPVPSPIDIGQVPPTTIPGLVPPPESTTAPIVAGSGSTTSGTPISMALKPDVEGNRGKSQLIDVASCQGPQTDCVAASSPGSAAEVSFTDADCHAMPTASGVDALLRETAREHDSGRQAESMIAVAGEDGQALADGAVAGDSAGASDWPAVIAFSQSERGTSDSPSLCQPVAMAAVAPDSVSASESFTSTHQGARLEPGDAAGARKAGSVSDLAAADATAVADVKSEEKAGKLLAAEHYCRADIVGLAVVAFAGQRLAQRWTRLSPGQIRPIAMRQQKPAEHEGHKE